MNDGEVSHAEMRRQSETWLGNLRFEQPQIFQVQLIDVVEAWVYSTNALEGAMLAPFRAALSLLRANCEFVPGTDEVVLKPFVSSAK